jgi:Flp pilus assembly protein TadG
MALFASDGIARRLRSLAIAAWRATSEAPAVRATRSLWRDRRGGTAVLVGLSAPALIGGLALSLDVGLWYLEKRKLQQISDTASLGAVSVLRSGGSEAAARSVALNDARRNGFVADDNSTLTVNIPPAEGPYAGDPNAVEIVVSKRLPLLFSSYFLTDNKTITARSVALQSSATATAPRRHIEVALMVDVSLSMAGPSDIPGVTKLQALQEATRRVVDVVVRSDQEPYSTRVAIVPYGSAVSVGDAYFGKISNTKHASSTAVIERTGPSAFTDDPPGPGSYFDPFRYGRHMAAGGRVAEKTTSILKTPALHPLSSDKEELKRAIDSFTAGGRTAGHIGLAWAWNVLSPKWSHVWGNGNSPTSYDGDTSYKVAVLLSDFDMTVTYSPANGPASEQALTLCTKMKQAGITIYTVGYRVPAKPAALRLWRGCASDADKVFAASTAEDLISMFSAIAQSAASQVMTSAPRLVE